MSNFLSVECTIEGVRALLQHAFGPEALPLEKQEKTGVAGHDPTEWKRTCLVTREGQLFIRPDYMFSCIVNGAKYTSRKRGTLMAPMAATLQITDDVLLLDRWMPPEPVQNAYTDPVYLDVRGARIPATKGRCVRYRLACAPGWHLTFHALFDKTIISRGEFEAVMFDAGRLVGLADGRSLGYGRFQMVDFTVSDGE